MDIDANAGDVRIPEYEDEVMTFVSVNRQAFDAIEKILNEACGTRTADSNDVLPRREFVNLAGGRGQLDVLLALAVESGLTVVPYSSGEIVIDAPGYPLSVVVKCDQIDERELHSVVGRIS